MKKVVSLLLVAVLLFTLSFSCFAVSGAVAGIAIDTVFSFVSESISLYNNSIQKRTEAARGYYFYCILNDDISGGISILDSSGKKFTDEILKFYFDRYLEALNGLDIYDSDGNIFIQAAGFPDTKFSLRLLSFAEYHIMQEDDGYDTTFNSFKTYYNTLLARYLLEQGQSATDPNPGKSGLDIAPGYVTSDELVEGIELDNSLFTLKGEYGKISYRTDDYYDKMMNFTSPARTFYYEPFIIDNNHFVSAGGTEEIYFVWFSKLGDSEYISEYQYRFYFDIETTYDDNGSAVSVKKYPRLQVWSNFDGSYSDPIEFSLNSSYDCSQYKYFSFEFRSTSDMLILNGFKTYSDYLNYTNYNSLMITSYWTYDTLYLFDLSSSVPFHNALYSSNHRFYGTLDYHSSVPCIYNDDCDIGLYVSSKPIDFTYRDIDTSRIPSNQIITINGDTIYNYTITNPDTGESNTINEYVTNNYTYITNNNGGEAGGSSSGSVVGGNVTVGGSIDVGGSVGVDINVSVPDININVNGGSGAGGSGSLPDTDLVDNLPEAPSGFIDYTASLFSFLPAEILSLLIAGLAAAIFCRIWGR